eukprot:Opistho-2@42852
MALNRPVAVALCFAAVMLCACSGAAAQHTYWVSAYKTGGCTGDVAWTPIQVPALTCVNVCNGVPTTDTCTSGFTSAFVVSGDNDVAATIQYACDSLCANCRQTATVDGNTCYTSLNFTGTNAVGTVGSLIVSFNTRAELIGGLLFSDTGCGHTANKFTAVNSGTCAFFYSSGGLGGQSFVINAIGSNLALVGPWTSGDCSGTPSQMSVGVLPSCLEISGPVPYSVYAVSDGTSVAVGTVVSLVAVVASLLLLL